MAKFFCSVWKYNFFGKVASIEKGFFKKMPPIPAAKQG